MARSSWCPTQVVSGQSQHHGVGLLCLQVEARWETVTVHPGLGYSLMISWCLPLSMPWSEATSFDCGSGPRGAFQSSSPSELPGDVSVGAAAWELQAELAGFEAERN